MNSFKSLFGKAAPKTTPKDAILKIRENIDLLDKREKYLQTKIQAELATAKENATKNKKFALMALKRKKLYEDQIEKILNSKMMLETQVLTIESANVNLETMNAMKAGAEGLKGIHGTMDINKVDSIKDDIAEQMDLANEISEAISQPVAGIGMEFDEDELDAELELLQTEEIESKYIIDAPSVPANAVPGLSIFNLAVAQPPRPVRVQSALDEEDAELAELKASMAM